MGHWNFTLRAHANKLTFFQIFTTRFGKKSEKSLCQAGLLTSQFHDWSLPTLLPHPFPSALPLPGIPS